MTERFNFTCMISCTFILRKLQRRNDYRIPEHMMRTTRKGQLLDHSQNIVLDLIQFISKYYELDIHFNDNRMKIKAGKSHKKDKSFHEKSLFIGKIWFLDMNLSGGDSFSMSFYETCKQT